MNSQTSQPSTSKSDDEALLSANLINKWLMAGTEAVARSSLLRMWRIEFL
jgi:hypothetical protein